MTATRVFYEYTQGYNIQHAENWLAYPYFIWHRHFYSTGRREGYAKKLLFCTISCKNAENYEYIFKCVNVNTKPTNFMLITSSDPVDIAVQS